MKTTNTNNKKKHFIKLIFNKKIYCSREIKNKANTILVKHMSTKDVSGLQKLYPPRYLVIL